MNSELELKNIAKNKLIQLLDYVYHQAEDTQKIQYEISGNRFYSHDLEKLHGLKVLNDGDWWFQIERLQTQPAPQPSEDLALYLHIDIETEPTIKFVKLNQILSFKKIQKYLLPSSIQIPNLIDKINLIKQLFKEFETYKNNWRNWKKTNDAIKKSITV